MYTTTEQTNGQRPIVPQPSYQKSLSSTIADTILCSIPQLYHAMYTSRNMIA